MSVLIGYSQTSAPTYTDADVDRMYEDESAAIWEEQNRIPNEDKYKAAAEKAKKAIEAFDKALDALNEAAEAAKDTIFGIKLSQKVFDIEDQVSEVKGMVFNVERGCEP